MVHTAELCDDRCPATATFIVVLAVDTGEPDFLTFCQHHKAKHSKALEAINARVMPMAALEELKAETKRLEAKAKTASG